MKRRDALKNSMWLATAGLSAGTISAIMTGCKADPGTISNNQFELSPQNRELIDAASQVIIPTTDTPGAKEANILQDFVDHVAYNFSPQDKADFINGLETIDVISDNLYSKSFVLLNKIEQEAVLNNVANQGGEKNIFETLKGMTVYLFFSSEIGATKVLNYLPVPGEYQPCVDLASVGSTWAL